MAALWATCPARMLRHTADHPPAKTTRAPSFQTQESVTWIKQRTKRRCCWRNAVKGFSCSRDRSSLSCAPTPKTSNTSPPSATCMATLRHNRPSHLRELRGNLLAPKICEHFIEPRHPLIVSCSQLTCAQPGNRRVHCKAKLKPVHPTQPPLKPTTLQA